MDIEKANGDAAPVVLEVVIRCDLGTGEFRITRPEGNDLLVLGMLSMASQRIVAVNVPAARPSGLVLPVGPRLA
jgi:hypothetical protein